jgi:hypothetical protein
VFCRMRFHIYPRLHRYNNRLNTFSHNQRLATYYNAPGHTFHRKVARDSVVRYSPTQSKPRILAWTELGRGMESVQIFHILFIFDKSKNKIRYFLLNSLSSTTRVVELNRARLNSTKVIEAIVSKSYVQQQRFHKICLENRLTE